MADTETQPAGGPAMTHPDPPRSGEESVAVDGFSAFVIRHQDRIAALAYRLLGWPEDVADVVQDVFLTSLRHLPRFRGDAQVTTWLHRVTVNACRRHRLRQRLRLWHRPRSSPPTAPVQPWAEHERCERVREAVRRLPSVLREVVVLRYLEDLAVADIAGILGLKNNAVEVRLSRARARLRTELADLTEE